MTTIAVVRKGTQVAIAADSLVTFGDTRLPHGYEANAKMFTVGGSWIGAVGTTAHMPVLRHQGGTGFQAGKHSGEEDDRDDGGTEEFGFYDCPGSSSHGGSASGAAGQP